MEVAHPAWFGAWAVIVAVAILARLRPARREMTVASLELWREAAQALEARHRRRRRRTRLAWWLLLIGAMLAAAALAGPRRRQSRHLREVALELRVGLELADADGPTRALRAVEALAERMEPDDSIAFLLPDRPGAVGVRAGEAADYLQDEFMPSSRPSRQLLLPQAPPGVAKIYTLAPAGMEVIAGPDASAILVASGVGPVRIGRFAGRFTEAGAELLVSVTNDTSEARSLTLEIRAYDRGQWRLQRANLDIPAASTAARLLRVPRADAYAALLPGAQGLATNAWLARSPRTAARIALIGEAQGELRRVLATGPNLEIVGQEDQAEVVVSYQAPLPVGASGIAIDPPQPPAGFMAGTDLKNVRLGNAAFAGDHPLLAGVDLGGVAVRRLKTWRARQAGAAEILGQIDGNAFLVASSLREGPRRVHISPELSGTNTNLTRSPGFVVLLANALEWLAPGAMEDTLEARAPHEFSRGQGWTRIDGEGPAGVGLWRGPEGELSAVTWPGLDWGVADPGAAERIAALNLPPADTRETISELWPWLAAGAIVCWLVGWSLKSRDR